MNRPDDVAIFWDYENCPVPSSSSGCAIANSITSLSRPFGSVKLFRAYLEIADQLPLSRSVGLRSELQSSGVSLIDCPHNGRKEVADKMIIVDMLAFAIDNPAPCTIVVISGDRDYAYALSVLKLRCYRMVLVTLPNAHTTLTAQASLCFDWSASVVNASVTPNNAVHPGPSSRYPIRHSHSQQPSLEPLSPPEYACQPPNLLPSTSPVGPEETPNITNFLQNRTHHRLSVSQTLPGGRSSSQPRAPERGIDNNATVTAIDSSRPPLAVPVATSPAPPLVADDASLAEVSNPLSYFRKEGRSGSTPGLLLSPNTVSLSTGVDLRNHDSVPTDGPVPESGSPGPSVHTVKLVEEVDEQHPTGTADVEDSDGDTDSSSGTTFIERPVSAPSTLPSLPQFATAPDATPVWLNGAQWEVDTPTNENTASFDNDSTPPSLQDVSSPLPVSPVKPRVIRSAGLPAFSFAAMARLQAVDLNKIEDAGLEPDIMPVISPKMIEPNRLSSLISVTNTTSTSPSSSAHYLTAPQTPQDKNVQLPDPNRTACPSPSSSTFPLPQTRIIPSEFVTLVQCLQMRIAHGHYRPLLTEVALQSAEVWAAASKTGSVGFGQNVNLAVKAGIIEMGGTERQPWISLKPEWHDAEPVLDSPDASNTPTASPSSSNPDPLRDGIDDGNKLDNSVSQDSAAEDLNSTQPNKTATLEPVVLEKDAEVPTPKKEQEAATIAIEHIALPSFGPQTSLDAIHPPIQAIEQPNPSAPDEPANITTDKYDVEESAILQFGTLNSLSKVEASQIVAPTLFSTIVSTGTLKVDAKQDEVITVPALKPIPSTSDTSTPSINRPIILSPFEILVQTLQEFRRENNNWPLRSDIALLISKNEDLDTCKQAGVGDFNQYFDLAEKEGIVALGGKEEKEWIGLCRKWYEAVPDPTLHKTADRKVDTPSNPPSFSSALQVPLSGEDTTNHVGTGASLTPGNLLAPVSLPPASQLPATGAIAPPNLNYYPPHHHPPQPPSHVPSSSSQPPLRQPPLPQPIIPIANFMLIVQTLREYQSKGNFKPLRSAIAGKIGSQVHQILTGEAYRRAGIQTFKQYLDWAVKLGMIETGGVERDAWISLHPQWSSVMPSVKNSLPPTPISTLLRPGDFLVLVKVLQALRLEGNWGPLWSQVAPHITLSGIYEKTGIKTLDDYVKLAVKQGIVDIGGEGGTRWMRLLPDWHLRVTA